MGAAARDKASLTGKVAVVTGAGGGLGGVMLRALVARGATAVAIDRNSAALERLRAEWGGTRFLGLAIDVADEDACRDALDKVRTQFGGTDIVINCAGITGQMPMSDSFPRFWERAPADWRKVQQVNSHGPLHMAYHAVRPMIRVPILFAALEQGKHVIQPMPFALDLEQGPRLRDLAVASGRVAMIEGLHRHSPAFRKMKAMNDAEAVGRVHMVRVQSM